MSATLLTRHGSRALEAGTQMSRVEDVRAAPFRWICSVLVELPSRSRTPITGELVDRRFIAGSGLVISPQHVLTCGHILRGRLAGEVVTPTRIVVIPARKPGRRTENRAPFGEWEVLDHWVHPNLMSSNLALAQSFDFGLLKLDSASGRLGDRLGGNNERYGWWGKRSSERTQMFAQTSAEGLDSRSVNIAGYPGRDGNADRMYIGFGRVLDSFPPDSTSGRAKPLLVYDVETAKGVSGGPVWTRDDDPLRRRLVAIHTGNTDGYGTGLLIRPTLISFLQSHDVSPIKMRVE